MYHHGGAKSHYRAVLLSVSAGATRKKDGIIADTNTGDKVDDLAPITLDSSTYSLSE